MLNEMIPRRILFWGIIFFCATFWGTGLIPSEASSPKDLMARADQCYNKLTNSPERQKFRHNWIQCIDLYEAVYKNDPEGAFAPAGLYMTALLYNQMYNISFKSSDKKEAIDCYERVIKRYSKSSYVQKAKNAIKVLSEPEGGEPPSKIQTEVSKNTKAPAESYQQAKSISDNTPARPAPPGYSIVTDLRVWSNPNYTRIVIDLDKETTYEYRLLKKDPELDKPQRLYIDFNKSKLGKNIQNFISINDDLLLDARAGQYTLDSVRVVADIKSFKSYNIFSLNNPFRIILDVWGDESGTAKADRPLPPSPSGSPTEKNVAKKPERSKKIETSAIAKQLALGVNRIVIDPGHGGKDFGASGIIKGIYEKDITLMIAKKLAKRIRETLKCEVILTRTTDIYLTLEERTAIANTKNADLFISIHTNAARNNDAYGVETFFLNLATDDESIMVAARENATSTKNISDLHSILNDLMKNAKINESSRLAESVQNELYSNLKINYSNIKNKGVKQAPFYVLLGARMPSILIETSFITNERECLRLASPEYQDHISLAIARGVGQYIKDTNPTAFQDKQTKNISKTKDFGG